MVKCLVSTFGPVLRVRRPVKAILLVFQAPYKNPKCSLVYRHIASTTYRKTVTFTASLYIVAMEQGIQNVCLSCVCVR